MAVDKLVDSTQLDSDLTSVANAIRAKSGGSSQLAFPAGFVSEIQAIPSGGGGGGATKVADGTITGAGEFTIVIPVGKKMPKADFIFTLWAENGTEYAYGATYQIVVAHFSFLKKFGTFDLSTDGNNRAPEGISVVSNNGGTLTTKTFRANIASIIDIRNGSLAESTLGNVNGSNNCIIIRSSTGFSVQLNTNNSSIILKSGQVYNWELLYIGSDPTNDIVEVP